jgi:hypothetical protein
VADTATKQLTAVCRLRLLVRQLTAVCRRRLGRLGRCTVQAGEKAEANADTIREAKAREKLEKARVEVKVSLGKVSERDAEKVREKGKAEGKDQESAQTLSQVLASRSTTKDGVRTSGRRSFGRTMANPGTKPWTGNGMKRGKTRSGRWSNGQRDRGRQWRLSNRRWYGRLPSAPR